MVNGWMVLLWVTVIVLGIVIIVLLVGAAYISATEDSSGGGAINDKPNCSELTSGLPDISDRLCCLGQGVVKYSYELSMDLSPSAIAYQSVCRQFCPEGLYDMTTDTCASPDPTITSQVDKCIRALKPTNCNGLAKPVAISYGTLYYGLRADLTGCPETACSQ